MTLEQVGILTALIASVVAAVVSLISALTAAKQSEIGNLRSAMEELRIENKRLLKRVDDGEAQHEAERKQWNTERERLNARITYLESRPPSPQQRRTGPLGD